MTKPVDEMPKLSQIIPRPLDTKVLGVLLLAALMPTLSEYVGNYGALKRFVRDHGMAQSSIAESLTQTFQESERAELNRKQYWAVFQITIYLLIPVLCIKLWWRERLIDYGLKLRGWHSKLWIYAAAFGVMIPLVWYFGKTPAFQRMYPFYSKTGHSWNDFLQWELSYALTFFSLEFFYRGLLIHGLKERFGYYCVFVAVVPYCMIHYGKPFEETIGAILAGVFLGTLSLWTRSIWLGVMIHITVALSMDLTSLYYKGELTKLFG